jgi:hypothetical protein
VIDGAATVHATIAAISAPRVTSPPIVVRADASSEFQN